MLSLRRRRRERRRRGWQRRRWRRLAFNACQHVEAEEKYQPNSPGSTSKLRESSDTRTRTLRPAWRRAADAHPSYGTRRRAKCQTRGNTHGRRPLASTCGTKTSSDMERQGFFFRNEPCMLSRSPQGCSKLPLTYLLSVSQSVISWTRPALTPQAWCLI